jgi:hypothetical protein
MPLAASDYPVAVKRRAVEQVNKVKELSVLKVISKKKTERLITSR